MYFIALGNPGEKYRTTRHNAGRIMLEMWHKDLLESGSAEKFSLNKKLEASTAEAEVDGKKVLLVEPETFMNLSGRTVRMLVDDPKKIEQLVVIQDEIELPIGTMKVSFDKAAAGHNGIRSIIDALGTKKFARIRVGVSPVGEDGLVKKTNGMEVDEFVLGKFTPDEKELLKGIKNQFVRLAEDFMEKGVGGVVASLK